MMKSFNDILDAAKMGRAKKLIVPNPDAADVSLLGEASAAGLVFPCCVGDGDAIRAILNKSPRAMKEYEIVEVSDSLRFLDKTLEVLHSGAGDILMQGGLPAKQFWMPFMTRRRRCFPRVGS